MSFCRYGSKKIDGADDVINPVEIGIFCFLFGLEGELCRLLDLVPEAIKAVLTVLNKPDDAKEVFEKLLWTVAKETYGIIIDEITGTIDTYQFCASPAPVFPDDITYYDIYSFIAELVPILNHFFTVSDILSGNSTKLLDKIVGIWLYKKWFENCECKRAKTGCTDPKATNFDSTAIVNDLSCVYPPIDPIDISIRGCTDPKATNFDGAASINDGSCIYHQPSLLTCENVKDRLIEQSPSDFDFLRYVNKSLVIVRFLYYPYANTYETRETLAFCILEREEDLFGVETTSVTANNRERLFFRFYVNDEEVGLFGDNTSSIFAFDYSILRCNQPTVKPPQDSVPPPISFCQIFPDHPLCTSCDNFEVTVPEFSACTLPRNYKYVYILNSGNSINIEVDIFVACDQPRTKIIKQLFDCITVWGCTDPSANNFNPDATNDDGSCIYDIWGCTDPSANNFNPDATNDDGSCIYDVWGCTDPSANNFNPDATNDDGSCIYDV